METIFTAYEVSDVNSEDDIYVLQSASNGQYAVFLFKNQNVNSTDDIYVFWKGRSAVAPSARTVFLQIYNRNSTTWETLDSDSITAANTKFTLSGSITANHADYYDAGHWVACRVQQQSQT